MEPSVFFLPDWPPALSPLLWIALAVVSAALEEIKSSQRCVR